MDVPFTDQRMEIQSNNVLPHYFTGFRHAPE